MSSHRNHTKTPISRIIRSSRSNHHPSHRRYNNHEHSLLEQSDPDSPTRSKYKSSRSNKKGHRTSKLKHKRARHQGKSVASRRKQRDINQQYKLYSLREIIDKISTKSSIISTNTAKETLITYYQTFTTSHELMDELEYRFFTVLPIQDEDKSARPYISDTDSVSERYFKYKTDSNQYDEGKAYHIQMRVINLLNFWMKEYFMEDFNEADMLHRLKSFVYKIKSLRRKHKLPSIPYDDPTPTGISDVPPIPDLNSEDNHIFSKLILDNKQKDIVIHVNKVKNNAYDGVSPVGTYHKNNHNKITSYHEIKSNHKIHKGFTVNSNPLHPANTNCNISIHTDIATTHIPSGTINGNNNADGIGTHSQNTIKTLKTEEMERIATIISPIHPVDDAKEIQRCYFPHSLFMTNPSDSTVFIPSDQLSFYSECNLNESTLNSCIVINGIHNTKVMIRNISDYNAMYNNNNNAKSIKERNVDDLAEKKALQLHEKPVKFKRHRNIIYSKHSEESDCKREVTENIHVVSNSKTSSEDLREHSMTSVKMEDTRITVEEPTFLEDNNVTPNSTTIVRRYYVHDPSKYKSLADKIEKVLFKQKREAPVSTHFIQNRRSMRLHKRDKSSSTASITSMAQLGSSLSGSKLIRERFFEDILPLKEDFQNKVKNRDIAEQITLMTFKAFKRVRKREFIDQAWKCKDRLELAGNLCQLIDHFNCISRWVQVTVLDCKDVKRRGRMIKKFIKIMDILLELNNFQSLCAVYGAITSSSIYSLEGAWIKVPDKHKAQFEEIKKFFITASNMANLRALHKERNPPMIPYTGIYLQDLIQTEERFKDRMLREQMKTDYDFSGSGGVVFDHLTKMSKQIDNILIYAKTPYEKIEDDHIIQKYILSEFADQAHLTDDEIYKRSENVAKND